MYTFVSVTVIAAVLFSGAASVLAKKRSLRIGAFSVSLVLLAVGILCLIAASVLSGRIVSDPALDAEFHAWAEDAYGAWARLCGTFSAVIGGVLLIAALIRHPFVKIRTFSAAIVSVLILSGGGMYAVTVQNATADLITPVYLFSIACACLVPICIPYDAAFALFFKPRKKTTAEKR
ncbi:MAG: hypothetical protein IJZ08_07280 [Clostridia bacterium]|nr:hypothetical protein [Clostridia bacterium]